MHISLIWSAAPRPNCASEISRLWLRHNWRLLNQMRRRPVRWKTGLTPVCTNGHELGKIWRDGRDIKRCTYVFANVLACWSCRSKAPEGQAHSTTSRTNWHVRERGSVLECACPSGALPNLIESFFSHAHFVNLVRGSAAQLRERDIEVVVAPQLEASESNAPKAG